ncbi:hypothetical protein [Pseudooceanicola spongiae]|uniref:Uncharacterized protein n=1 Tax=Pseudooceanicola spongiae TaxID=2613965 RepID=A0A7L9WNV5_9RHOB|nr:hypothetical protein [Pseudooceanicola spongiae]QOL81096.1 hypothetical protein F3W81_09910 [Pseudooceanicola spongiae]|tara:strand:+ start:453 stop:1079 length:627 start_codon:yes stop_codon:yes gene_type:complete
MSLAQLKPTGSEDLEQYPIASGTRLESHYYFKFHHDRWLNSDFFLLTSASGDWDVQGVALALRCRAQEQDPVGTLPVRPVLIAALLSMPLQTWESFSRRDPSPLDGWRTCLVGNTVRLMHPEVTEVALDALGQRDKAADRAAADRERQAITRLRKTVDAMGMGNIAGQERFLVGLHRWLDEAYPAGNRTSPRILEGVEALTRQTSARF